MNHDEHKELMERRKLYGLAAVPMTPDNTFTLDTRELVKMQSDPAMTREKMRQWLDAKIAANEAARAKIKP